MKKTFFVITLFLLFIKSNCGFAWDGYDYENKTKVEIGTGNLVREGMIIDFYDENLNEYRSAKVIQLNSFGHGSEVIIIDLETDQERTLVME